MDLPTFVTDHRASASLRHTLDGRTLASPKEVIGQFMRFDGAFGPKLRQRVLQALEGIARDVAPELAPGKALDRHGAVHPSLVKRFADPELGVYPHLAQAPDETLLLPASSNELFEPDLDARFRADGGVKVMTMLTSPARRALSLLHRTDADVALNGQNYVTLDRGNRGFVPLLSNRNMPTGLLATAPEIINGHLVILRDWQANMNFAHFLLDVIPRLLIFAEREPVAARHAFFLLDVAPSPMSELVLQTIAPSLGLDPARFLSLGGRRLLRPTGAVYGFSDQIRHRARPMVGCHPVLFDATRRALARIPGAPEGRSTRLYISRKDATRRRIHNERDIEPLLASRGFSTVALAHLPLARQIALMRGADVVFGPHGMGLAHLIFHPAMPTVLEILHPSNGTLEFRSIARAAGGVHDFVVGSAPKTSRHDVVAKPALVEAMLEKAGIH